MTPEFLLTSLVVVLIPGTGVIYTASTGLFLGWRAGMAAAAGCTAGIIPHLLASILGLIGILHLGAMAFQLVKYAGVIYLCYLAWMMWRETGSLRFAAPAVQKSFGRIALRGGLINILNPKLSIFFLAFLPQFITAGASSPLVQMLLLSGVFMGMTLGVFILYGICAHGIRARVIDSPRLMRRLQRSCALVFALLGLRLATAER